MPPLVLKRPAGSQPRRSKYGWIWGSGDANQEHFRHHHRRTDALSVGGGDNSETADLLSNESRLGAKCHTVGALPDASSATGDWRTCVDFEPLLNDKKQHAYEPMGYKLRSADASSDASSLASSSGDNGGGGSTPLQILHNANNNNDAPTPTSPGLLSLQIESSSPACELLLRDADVIVNVPTPDSTLPSQSSPSQAAALGDQKALSSSSPIRNPPERHKCAMSLGFLMFSWICTVGALAVVHDKVPSSDPLPDIVYSMVPEIRWALATSEYIIVFGLVFCALLVWLHKYRWIIMRRLGFIVGMLYLGRSITMLVTALPPPDPNYPCEPKVNTTSVYVFARRITTTLLGGGLTINGKYSLCGDYIYSGHTCILVMFYLVTREYAPRRLFFLSAIIWLSSLTGIVLVSISRGHYTIDIVIAYYVTTRIFWIYHTLAGTPSLKEPSNTNHLSRLWWFPIFRYMERNVVDAKLPNQYEWPLPWPRTCGGRGKFR